ncbi:MAG: hypothetical protein COA74_11170 [Gammaproteobacteria bacterium]|nr:MAG: hypothetical protein COA74_11170 [Gammaproteobacteria bacterium]
MTSSQTASNNNNEITATAVADYLKQHSDFFQQHSDLMLMMDLTDHSDGSISLVERQMKGLRQRNKETDLELQQVIRNAQDNQNLLQQTISLTLQLIPAENVEQLSELIVQQLSTLFDIQYSNLLLNSDHFSESSADLESIRKTLGDNFPKQQPVSGRLKSAEKKCLFTDHERVNSAAILPLGEKGELGLLVMGSEDQTHFDPAMGDLFLLLISDTLSKLLYRFTQ